MTTLNEDLERVATTLRSITGHHVEVHPGEDVYVNFGHREALVVEPTLTPNGLRWVLTAYAWDITGGVDAEHHIDVTSEVRLPVAAKAFLDQEDEQAAKLERLLSEMPEDM